MPETAATLGLPPPASSLVMNNNVKVANISSLVNLDVLNSLFGFLGEIRNIALQPSPFSTDIQECVIEFSDALAVQTALHLTGTELGDRTLVVTANYNPPPPGTTTTTTTQTIPPYNPASVAPPGTSPHLVYVRNSTPLAPPGVVTPSTSVSPVAPPASMFIAANPVAGLAGFDPVRAEEISRTIYIGNITGYVTEDQLVEVCSSIGPVSHIKLAGSADANTRFAFVEFTHVDDARKALNLNGSMLADRPLKVSPSKNAINKPANLRKAADSADVVAAMQRVREAQQRIASKYGVGNAAPGAPPPTGPPPALPISSTSTDKPSSQETVEKAEGSTRPRSRSRSRDRYRRNASPGRERNRSRSRERYGRYDIDRRRDVRRSRSRTRSKSRDRRYGRARMTPRRERDRDYDRRDDWSRRRDYMDRDEYGRKERERGRELDAERRLSKERSIDYDREPERSRGGRDRGRDRRRTPVNDIDEHGTARSRSRSPRTRNASKSGRQGSRHREEDRTPAKRERAVSKSPGRSERGGRRVRRDRSGDRCAEDPESDVDRDRGRVRDRGRRSRKADYKNREEDEQDAKDEKESDVDDDGHVRQKSAKKDASFASKKRHHRRDRERERD